MTQSTKENPLKKSAGESASRKQKIRWCDDPEIHQPCPKIRHKNFQQIRLSNLQVHARHFLIEKFCSWGRFQRTDSRTLFGCVLLMVEASHAETHLQSLSCCWWEGQGLLRPFQTTFLVKNVRVEKRSKIKNIRHATLPTLATQSKDS